MEAERIIERIYSDTLVLHNLSKYKGQEVEVIILPVGKRQSPGEDLASKDLLRFANAGGSFDFLDDPLEDIYTMADGNLLYD